MCLDQQGGLNHHQMEKQVLFSNIFFKLHWNLIWIVKATLWRQFDFAVFRQCTAHIWIFCAGECHPWCSLNCCFSEHVLGEPQSVLMVKGHLARYCEPHQQWHLYYTVIQYAIYKISTKATKLEQSETMPLSKKTAQNKHYHSTNCPIAQLPNS